MKFKEVPLLVKTMTTFVISGGCEVSRPGVPMPGGHGVRLAGERYALCDRFLYPFSNIERARFVMHMLYLQRVGSQKQGRHYWSTQLRSQASDWFIHHRATLFERAKAQLGPGDDALEAERRWFAQHPFDAWKPVVASLLRVASQDWKTAEVQDQWTLACDALLASEDAGQRIDRSPVTTTGWTLGERFRSDARSWSVAAEVLDDVSTRDSALAAYFNFRLHALLCVPVQLDRESNPLYVFLRRRFVDIRDGRDLPFTNEEKCKGKRADLGDLVRAVFEPLMRLKCFGGDASTLQLAEGLPSCFLPFRFQTSESPLAARAALVHALNAKNSHEPGDLEVVARLTAADLLAQEIFESLMDPMRLDQLEYKVNVYTEQGSSSQKSLAIRLGYMLSARHSKDEDSPAKAFDAARRNLKTHFDPRKLEQRLERVRAAKQRLGLSETVADTRATNGMSEPLMPPGFHWACPACGAGVTR